MLHRKLYARLVFYPTYYWNLHCAKVRKIRNWWDRIDENVIVGALPRRVDVPLLHHEGVTGVVNTCEEYRGPLAAYQQFGIEQFRMPTIDFTHPKLRDVEAAVEFIRQHAKQGGTVYVHCKAGRARSATVALCWLVETQKLSPAEGQILLLEKRRHINPRLTERSVVQEFARARGFAVEAAEKQA